MGSKTKIALLIPGLLAMLILISPKVAMAARNFKESEVVEETNEAGDSRLVDDFKILDIIPDILNRVNRVFGAIPGIVGGNFPGGGGIPGINGGIPGISGGDPGINGGIPGISGGIPGFSGGIPGFSGAIPRYGGFFGGSYTGQGGYRGGPYCPYGCCVWAPEGDLCTSCCRI